MGTYGDPVEHNFLRNLAGVAGVVLSVALNHGRRMVVAYMGLVAVTMASLPSAVAQAAARSPVRLLGNAVGGARFGARQATAIDDLATMFGSLKATDLKAIDWCGLTAQSTGLDVLFSFERGKFVGYELGNASGKTAGQPKLWPSGHHDHDFPHMWCAAPPGAQGELVTTGPDRFFRPPYVGGRGWIGIRLDGDVDWGELTAVCEDAFRAVATKKLVAELDRVHG